MSVRAFTAIPPGKLPTLTVAGRRPQPVTISALQARESITATVGAPRSATYTVPSVTATANGAGPTGIEARTWWQPLLTVALQCRPSITETVFETLFAT